MPRKLKPSPSDLARVDDALQSISGEIDVYLTKKSRLDNPEYGYAAKAEKKPCAWPFKKAFAPRVELEIVTGRKADKLDIPAGPALRFCFEKDEAAPLVSVESIGNGSVKDVVEFGNEYLACLKKQGKGKSAAKACALDTAKDVKYQIAGLRRKRRSRR